MIRFLRWFYLTSWTLGLLLTGAQALSPLQVAGQAREERVIYVLRFSGAVTPVLGQYINDGIQAAQETGAEALILELDTPGGSVEVTKRIVQEMLASSVPIVVYVSPPGAHAGSAGTFITLAAHVAAMAPGTSIGAASPVGSGGEDIGETLEQKVKNILAADIRNLASRRGEKAVEWAVAAVQEAAAATAEEALELGVIDFVATDLEDLLEQMDGFTVVVQGSEQVLRTRQAGIRPLEMNGLQQFLNFISNPTVATILLTLGSIGLIAELYNPGSYVPGIVGLISLLLGLYALGQLDANFAGVALILVAIGLFVAEAFTPTFGALALGGAVAFLFGSALLFDAPGLAVPWPTILSMTGLLLAFTLFAGGKALAAQRRQPYTGMEALMGQEAVVREAFDERGEGIVFLAGERWRARLISPEKTALEPGAVVRVVGNEGYTLLVEPIST